MLETRYRDFNVGAFYNFYHNVLLPCQFMLILETFSCVYEPLWCRVYFLRILCVDYSDS